MGRYFGSLFFCLGLFLLPNYSLAINYYVNGASGNDAGAGSLDSPWKTIHKANATLAPGDTVYIRGGTSDFQNYYVGALDSLEEGINPDNSGTDADHRITYAVYPGEKVHLIGTTSGSYGINIADRNWIKVTGYGDPALSRNLKISNVQRGFYIWSPYPFDGSGSGSDFNEISYIEIGTSFWVNTPFWQTSHDYSLGDFVKAKNDIEESVYELTSDNGSSGAIEPIWCNSPACTVNDGNLVWTRRSIADYRGSTIYCNSQYNWIHHCTFHDNGGYGIADIGGLLEIGYEESEPGSAPDNTGYNVVEDNIFYHGGHHVLGLHRMNNVIRRNNMHNEQYFLDPVTGVYHSYRLIYAAGDYDNNHGYNLIEGNTLSHSSENVNTSKGHIFDLAQSNDIVRYNDFFAANGMAIFMESSNGFDHERCNSNHIYNNTFFANGYGATFPSIDNPPGRDTWDRRSVWLSSGPTAGSWTYMMGNVIKNNLFWKNYSGPEGGAQIISHMYNDGWDFDNCGGYTTCGNSIVTPNWVDSNGDPKFTSEGDYGSPEVNIANIEWYWPHAPTGEDITILNAQPDFSLQSSSPAIDGATHLTQASASGSNSMVLVVDDAKYFQDGWGNGAGGGASVAADWIAIGNVNSIVQIDSINYDTNTITLASPMDWNGGDYIWLYKKSDGSRVIYGGSGDYGSHEYQTESDTTAPENPSGLSVR